MLKKVEVGRHISSCDIAKELNMDQKTVLNHLRKTGYQKKFDTWVAYKLVVKKLMDR